MNKKRGLCVLLLLCAALLFCGCRKEEEESGYTIYYKNTDDTSLYGVNYSPSAQTFDEMMTELLGQLAAAPENSGYVSTLPETVQIQGYERGIDALRIDFSSEYYDMTNIEEVLLRAAVVKTVCQIPGVTKIMITVDAQQLVDDEGQLVPAMDSESFIDTKNGGINSYQYAALVLYFPNQDGTLLEKEVRKLHYSSNMVLERVIVEQLAAGSENSGRGKVLHSSAEVLDVGTKDGICTINVNAAFNQPPAEGAPAAEIALYAIVDSICSTADDITGVKLTVEGESNVKFWGEIDLNQVFSMNISLIETEALESESDTERKSEAATESGTAASESAAAQTEGTDGAEDASGAEKEEETTVNAGIQEETAPVGEENSGGEEGEALAGAN